MQPVPPPRETRRDEEQLQSSIRVELTAEEHEDKHQTPDDARGPSMNAVACREPNRQRHDGVCGNFQCVRHGALTARRVERQW